MTTHAQGPDHGPRPPTDPGRPEADPPHRALPTPAAPSSSRVVAAIERIVIAGVGMTTISLASGGGGVELTMPQWRVLMLLGGDADGARVSHVAGALGVTLPATGRQLRRLAWRGLLVLEPDAHDRRVTRARLTSVGWALRSAVLAERRRLIVAALADLDLPEPSLATLDAVADAVEAALASGGQSR